MRHAFSVLGRFKFLRGSLFDPFGYHQDRRQERQLIDDYRALIRQIVERLSSTNVEAAIELAGAASDIRGYGPVKQSSIEAYEARRDQLLADFEMPVVAHQLENI